MPDREDRVDEKHADSATQVDARGAQGVAIGNNNSVVITSTPTHERSGEQHAYGGSPQ
jgi:hypothetical protein